MFSPFGRIIECRLLTEPLTGKSRNIAFVQYDSRNEATEGVYACVLRVCVACVCVGLWCSFHQCLPPSIHLGPTPTTTPQPCR
jgi:hypothetical protein